MLHHTASIMAAELGRVALPPPSSFIFPSISGSSCPTWTFCPPGVPSDAVRPQAPRHSRLSEYMFHPAHTALSAGLRLSDPTPECNPPYPLHFTPTGAAPTCLYLMG
jgi:hypothetical protein